MVVVASGVFETISQHTYGYCPTPSSQLKLLRYSPISFVTPPLTREDIFGQSYSDTHCPGRRSGLEQPVNHIRINYLNICLSRVNLQITLL